MKDFTIAIYCLLDDLLLKMDTEPIDKRRKLTDPQVITTALLAAKHVYGNQASACSYRTGGPVRKPLWVYHAR